MKKNLHLLIATAALALLCPRAGAAAAGESKITKLSLRDNPIDSILSQIKSLSGKSINTTADILAVRFKDEITMENVTKAEAVALLREFLEKQAGVVFDEQPDGAWQARLIARDRDSKAEGLVFKNANSGTLRDTLVRWAAGKKFDVSYGVLKNTVPCDLSIYGASREQAAVLLRDALEKQAGIATRDLPDGTLQLRLKTGDNDPVVPAVDFNSTPVDRVLDKLREVTGKDISRTSNLPPQNGRGRSAFVGLALTLHIEPAPASQVYTLLRDALEKQAGVLLAETPDGLGLTARLAVQAPAPAAKQP